MRAPRAASDAAEVLPRALTRLALGHPRLVVAACALLVATAAWRVARLRLDTDFAALLPARDPAVLALKEMERRMASLSSLTVVVEGPDAAANRRYVDALAPRLRALGHPAIDEVTTGVQAERQFLERNKYLYAPLGDLEDARDRLRRHIAARKNPLLADLDDDDGGIEGVERTIAGRAAPFDRFPTSYFSSADGSLYAVVVWLRAGFLAAGAGTDAAMAIDREARALAAAMPSAGQTVGLTGNVITAAEERAALAADLGWATGLSTALVCLVVLLFFGRLAAVPFMVLPAVVGVVCALGFAQLAFGALNTATGFMGAIIVGNGINFAIIQMARYEEERRLGRAVPEALGVALASTWRATGLASLGAAIAYGSLAITEFRGFNQFGYIGAVGMLLAWAATLTLLPALWVLFDRRSPSEAVPRVRGFALFAPLGRLAVSRSRTLLAVGAVVTIAAALPLPRYLGDPFEYDFDKLRNQVSKNSPSEILSSRLDPIFGRSLSPSFVLADRAEQVPEIRRLLLAADRDRHVLGAVKAIDDFLPGTPDEQRGKLAVIAEIRRALDDNRDLAADGERATIDRLRPADDLAVITAPDLPPGVRRYYTERDGTIGRVVAYFPREDVNVWDGRVQMKLAAVVRDVRLADGSHVRSSGAAVIFAGILDAIGHDAPIVTGVSLGGVLALVLALARRRGAWLIVGSLCVGTLWMVGAVAAAGVRLNFLNFVALPITFGIGLDYAVNVYLRYRLEGAGGLERAVGATGGAVALCSLTTIIGYGSLLTADTEGLRSFGAAAILGEVACLSTAVLLLPAAVAVLERRAPPPAAREVA